MYQYPSIHPRNYLPRSLVLSLVLSALGHLIILRSHFLTDYFQCEYKINVTLEITTPLPLFYNYNYFKCDTLTGQINKFICVIFAEYDFCQ